MGYVGNEKGMLESNSTVTSYRVRCAAPECQEAKIFKPQSMTLVQRDLADAGWVYTPGKSDKTGETPGLWRCPACAAAPVVEEEEAVSTTDGTDGADGEEVVDS